MIKLLYEIRLERQRLWSLEERRYRGDLVEVFKMFKGFTDIPWQTFFHGRTYSNTTTQLEANQADLQS